MRRLKRLTPNRRKASAIGHLGEHAGVGRDPSLAEVEAEIEGGGGPDGGEDEPAEAGFAEGRGGRGSRG
jgi:hypothetical protein